MIPKILKYILCFFLCTAIAIPLSFGVSAASVDDIKANISTVQAPSTVDSGIQTAITNAGGEVKGLMGNIIANIFDGSQMIKNEFIAAFQSIRTSFTNNVPKWDGGKFVESPIYSSGGNVGIGTTSPATKLHVNGGITGDYFYAQNNTSSKVISGGTGWNQGGNIFLMGPSSSFSSDIRFRAGSATNMILKGNTGNVGIGTVSPSEKLHVDGNMRVNQVRAVQYCDENGNNCFSAAGGGNKLVRGEHTRGECVEAGGSVVKAGTADVCRFDSSSCPGGWHQFYDWGKHGGRTCWKYHKGARCDGDKPCTIQATSWGNMPSTCIYIKDFTDGPDDCESKDYICQVNFSSVGCY